MLYKDIYIYIYIYIKYLFPLCFDEARADAAA